MQLSAFNTPIPRKSLLIGQITTPYGLCDRPDVLDVLLVAQTEEAYLWPVAKVHFEEGTRGIC